MAIRWMTDRSRRPRLDRPRRIVGGIACVLALVFAGHAHAGRKTGTTEVAPLRDVYISAPVSVSATGQGEIGEVQGIRGAFAQQIRQLLAQRRFLPARNDGMPVAGSSWIRARLSLTRVATGDIDVELHDVEIAPKFDTMQLITPELTRLLGDRPGRALLHVRIDERGHASLTGIGTSPWKDAERSFSRLVRTWRLTPTLVNGVAVPIEGDIVFEHNPHDPRSSDAALDCRRDPKLPSVEGQGTCLDRIAIDNRIVGTTIQTVTGP